MQTQSTPDLDALKLDHRLLVSDVRPVESDWLDYNGHLNMAFYNVLFDRGVDDAFATFGLGSDSVASRNSSFFSLEVHICYLGEIVGGDETISTFQLLDHDSKRVHFFQSLYRLSDGLLSATSEQLSIHVDMTNRRSAPFPDDIAMRISECANRQNGLAAPQVAGRAVGIRRG